MKSIVSTLIMGVVLSMAPSIAMAKDCSCNEKCQKSCETGKSKNCKCKDCDCATTGKCSHEKLDAKKAE